MAVDTLRNRDVEIGREYVKAVRRRGQSLPDPDPLVPRDYTVDWADRPSPFKLYRDVARLQLSHRPPAEIVSTRETRSNRAVGRTSADLSYESLSTLLLLSSGLLRRKLEINWNDVSEQLTRHGDA